MEAPIYYPVQECHRMHLLRTTLPICLEKTFEQFSYAAFCSCFDEKVTKANGELFENLYTQLVDILKNFVQTEFDLLLFQSEVGNRLSLMENLIALAQRQGSELPAFNAAEIARDIRVNLKLREKQRLTESLNRVTAEVSATKESLTLARDKANSKISQLNKITASFAPAIQASHAY